MKHEKPLPEEEGQFLVRTFVDRDWVTRIGDVVEVEEELEDLEEEDGGQHEEWDGRTTAEIPIIKEEDTEEGEETKEKGGGGNEWPTLCWEG